MKKWLLISAIVLTALVIGIYILIPSHLQVAVVTDVRCSVNGSNRVMLDESSWGKWWPDELQAHQNNTAKIYFYNNLQYNVKDKLYNQFIITTGKDGRTYSGKLVLLPITN